MYKQLGSGKYQGLLKDSSTDTVIRFFEKAPERRAYCHGYVGENANKECKISDCRVIAYERQEERKDFDTLILPETCENPRYSEESVRGSCQSNGYTQFVCQGCGYCIKGHYTPRIHTYRTEVLSRSCTEGDLLLLSCETCVESKEERTEPRGHSRGEWQLLTPPQVGIEGLEGVLCSVCGELLEQRAVPALESTPEPKISVSLQEPIETPEPTNMPTASAEAKAEETLSLWDWILKYILFGWLFNK